MDKYAQFADFLKTAKNIFVLTGAGMSTDSGIKDFRSEDGLYNQEDEDFKGHDPEYMLSSRCLYNEPKLFYKYYRKYFAPDNFSPNEGHKILAEFEQKFNMSIATQNIDGLHEMAGSKKVYNLHGTSSKCYCTKCKKKFKPDDIFKSESLIPKCPNCKGVGFIRPAITLYGELLPENDFYDATVSASNADLMIVLGSSLVVYPVAYFVTNYAPKNRKLIIVNKQETPFDNKADLVIHEDITEVLKKVKENL